MGSRCLSSYFLLTVAIASPLSATEAKAPGGPSIPQPALHQAATAATGWDVPDGEELPAARRKAGSLVADLGALDAVQRARAQLTVEPFSDDASTLTRAASAESAWNWGRHDAALQELAALEAEGLGFAFGISWKQPMASKLSGRQISSRYPVRDVSLDAYRANGNLFAVLQTDDSSHRWSVHLSTDEGASWAETFVWSSADPVEDTCGRASLNHFYVAYITSGQAGRARTRRFDPVTGAVDTAYGFHDAVDTGGALLEEVALETLADWGTGEQIYVLGIVADGRLLHSWSPDGVAWHPVATTVADADHHLDVHLNAYSPDNKFLLASYVATDGRVKVWRAQGSSVDVFDIAPYTADRVSVSAYRNEVIVALLDGTGVYLKISFDGGDSWWYSTMEGDYSCPDITLRNGLVVVQYFEETGAFDLAWTRWRRSYLGWQTAEPYNDLDVWTGADSPVAVEHLPCGVGAVTVNGTLSSTLVAQFEKLPMLFTGNFESGEPLEWSSTVP